MAGNNLAHVKLILSSEISIDLDDEQKKRQKHVGILYIGMYCWSSPNGPYNVFG